MMGAEPSRGPGRGCTSADAPAAEAKRRLQDAQRVRRYRDRQARCQAVGRFTITEDLVTALIASGDLCERDALTKVGIEQGVNAVLARFSHNQGGW